MSSDEISDKHELHIYKKLEPLKDKVSKLEATKILHQEKLSQIEDSMKEQNEQNRRSFNHIRSDLEGLNDKVDAKFTCIEKKLDSITKLFNRATYIAVGVSGTVGVIWAIAINIEKIIKLFS